MVPESWSPDQGTACCLVSKQYACSDSSVHCLVTWSKHPSLVIWLFTHTCTQNLPLGCQSSSIGSSRSVTQLVPCCLLTLSTTIQTFFGSREAAYSSASSTLLSSDESLGTPRLSFAQGRGAALHFAAVLLLLCSSQAVDETAAPASM